MQIILKTIASILIAPMIWIAGIAGYDIKKTTDVPNVPVVVETQPAQQFGADGNLFFGGFPYYLAGSGMTSSASSFTLTSLTLPQNSYPIQDSDLSSTFYITFEPGSKTRQEFASCTTVGANTGGNVTISGCTRGLSAISPYTASTTQRFSHAGGTSVIFSNSPSFYDKLASLDNAEAVTGLWTFNTVLPTSSLTATTSSQFTTKSYVDGVALVSAPDADLVTKGVVEFATQAEMAAGTATGGTSANMSLWSSYASSTPTVATTTIPITKTNGKLHQSFLDLTEDFSLSGNNTHSGTNTFNTATTTFNATTSIAATSNNPLMLNGVNYNMPSSDGASSTSLMTNGSGTLTWNTTDWAQLGETVLGGASATTSVSGLSAKKDLRLVINITGMSSSDQTTLCFNTECGGSNYGFTNYENTTQTSFSSVQHLGLVNSATTSPMFIVVDILNENSYKKIVKWDGVSSISGATSPMKISGVGTWNNTSSQITQIDLRTSSLNTFTAGTRVTVYGKRD